MVDFRRFLGKKENVVLPYLGGARVFARDRTLRLEGEKPAIGFWMFEIEGRHARATARADPGFSGMPRLRGHLVGSWLFTAEGGTLELELLPEEEAPVFSVCHARRSHEGAILFESALFDGDPELLARAAFEEGRSLAFVKGIGAPLRFAFAYAVAARIGKKEEVPVSPSEVRPKASEIAEGVERVVLELLMDLEKLRKVGRVRVGAERRVLDVHKVIDRAAARRGEHPTKENAEERAERALAAAGATLASIRHVNRGTMEVTFRFADQRFICRVQPITLNVLDAGICLVDHYDGHRGDSDLTLDSLPSAIREAIDGGVLVITRR